MNVLGNRHIGGNLRVIVINNGHGQEFEMYNHAAAVLGEEVNQYVAAAGHFGQKSKDLVKHYAQDLGFKYMSAETTDEFNARYEQFVSTGTDNAPIVFEIFTTNESENKALLASRSIDIDKDFDLVDQIKRILKKNIVNKGINVLRKIVRK